MSLLREVHFKFVKYKIDYLKNFYPKAISNIFIHILIWVIFLGSSITQIYLRFGFIPNDFLFRWAILIFAFYLNYNILVPKLLLNKKVLLYIFVTITFCLLFLFILKEIMPKPEGKLPFAFNNNIPPQMPKDTSFFSLIRFFPGFSLLILSFALSTSIKLSIEWYKTEKRRVLVESQKTSSELSFLKAQLNPHFLFNSLNSIYALANKKSDDTTIAIITLSELMRYMIYEANENIVSLQKEIEHIQNYISLQLLRLQNTSGVKVNIHGDLNYKIEPLLLISFIENAFKYGTDFKGTTNIQIRITIENEKLYLYVYNTASFQKVNSENSGIGLENIKNRLNLLYPNSHTLDITNDKKSYQVNLTIKLKPNDK